MEERGLRFSLGVGSRCSVYSRSKRQWFSGRIARIFVDTSTNQEWLVVKYGSNKSKKMQRFCEDLQIMKPEPEEDTKYNMADKDADSDVSDLETEGNVTQKKKKESIQSTNSPLSSNSSIQSNEHYPNIVIFGGTLGIHKASGHHSNGKSSEYLPKEIAKLDLDNSVLETMGPILLK